MNKSQKLARSKLVKSLIIQFPRCSMKDAYEWADNIIASESQANGRIGNFEEITESKSHETEIQSENIIKMRARAKAGLKSFNALMNNDAIKMKIQYLGGMRS